MLSAGSDNSAIGEYRARIVVDCATYERWWSCNGLSQSVADVPVSAELDSVFRDDGGSDKRPGIAGGVCCVVVESPQ